jgi:hypothetical protein
MSHLAPQVEPNFKDNKGPCEGRADYCTQTNCPLFGTLGKPGRDGRRRVRGCGDPVARGKRNRTKGDSQARKSRKLLGLVGANSRHEEHLGGPLRMEAKAGAQVGPIWTRFQAARAQSEAARPIGDHRPFVMAAHPDGTSEFLLVVSSRDWAQVVCAAAEQFMGDGAA